MKLRLIYTLAFLLALSSGRVDAAVYFLLTNATTTNTVPPGPPYISPTTGTTGGPLENQAFEVVASVPGSSCTVQIVGSNDAVNWVTYGAAISAATPSSPQGAVGTTPWAYFGALVTAISGTGAKCTVTMSG